ncbi:hypothetical protein B0T26DRAFT_803602 [Lasiosphaeria miniovina]|uniref:Uncharacterized protein n=1 Tax=Lasiosphaeria miniovina TaxID=1954250 RepID=A0AA40DT68_9PEZI|nr:uncharacterized protein B0T26DRAFT_803602 [Lasiosphaeria miniovina]KAK0712551.1 hypothetical protein B0T26DRAFT_803602 [Lasiosphaeria miniovina]
MAPNRWFDQHGVYWDDKSDSSEDVLEQYHPDDDDWDEEEPLSRQDILRRKKRKGVTKKKLNLNEEDESNWSDNASLEQAADATRKRKRNAAAPTQTRKKRSHPLPAEALPSTSRSRLKRKKEDSAAIVADQEPSPSEQAGTSPTERPPGAVTQPTNRLGATSRQPRKRKKAKLQVEAPADILATPPPTTRPSRARALPAPIQEDTGMPVMETEPKMTLGRRRGTRLGPIPLESAAPNAENVENIVIDVMPPTPEHSSPDDLEPPYHLSPPGAHYANFSPLRPASEELNSPTVPEVPEEFIGLVDFKNMSSIPQSLDFSGSSSYPYPLDLGFHYISPGHGRNPGSARATAGATVAPVDINTIPPATFSDSDSPPGRSSRKPIDPIPWTLLYDIPVGNEPASNGDAGAPKTSRLLRSTDVVAGPLRSAERTGHRDWALRKSSLSRMTLASPPEPDPPLALNESVLGANDYIPLESPVSLRRSARGSKAGKGKTKVPAGGPEVRGKRAQKGNRASQTPGKEETDNRVSAVSAETEKTPLRVSEPPQPPQMQWESIAPRPRPEPRQHSASIVAAALWSKAIDEDTTATNPEPPAPRPRGRRLETSPERPRWPPHPGHIYCERCFRDDCARWLRIQHSALDAVETLGGDGVLRDLRAMGRQLEQMWRDTVTFAASRSHDVVDIEEELRRALKDFEYETAVKSVPVAASAAAERGVKRKKGEEARQQQRPAPSLAAATAAEAAGERARMNPVPVQRSPADVFRNLPADVKGFLLLRYLAAARREENIWGRNAARRAAAATVKKSIDALQRHIGVSTPELKRLEVHFGSLLGEARARSYSAHDRQLRGHSWWSFDDTLVVAHRQLEAAMSGLPGLSSPARSSPARSSSTPCSTRVEARSSMSARSGSPFPPASLASAFDNTLASKARSVMIGALNKSAAVAREAAERLGRNIWGVDKNGAGPRSAGVNSRSMFNYDRTHDELDGLRRTAMADKSGSAVLLLRIGEAIAHVRARRHEPRGEAEFLGSDTVSVPAIYEEYWSGDVDAEAGREGAPPSPPARKRRRSERSTAATTRFAANGDADRGGDAPVLACVNCSESRAVHRRAARQTQVASDERMPWMKPLMWAYGLDEGTAARMAPEDLFRQIAQRPGTRTVQIAGLLFLIDVTGGETRVVLVEMRSIFDDIWKERADKAVPKQESHHGEDDNSKVATPPLPMGLWEKWQDGELTGYSML